MIATLEFIRASDYATILPATMCTRDIGARSICLNPLVDPELTVSYAVVEPSSRMLPPAGAIFLDLLKAEYAESGRGWREVLEPA